MNVPFLDLSIQHRLIKDELDRVFDEIIGTTAFIQGEQVERFEREFADYVHSRHAIGVANGTDALHLSLRACGIGPGDEVITAANTFIATTEAISAVGATIVLVDMDPVSYTIDPAKIEASITPRTKAIIPVHLYGQPADMAAIMDIADRHGLLVVEDACQAHGARYGEKRVGTIGAVGCFSCYPGKNLGAYGDAGIIVTDDDAIADRIRLLANHGSRKKYEHEIEGWNSRLDTLQAAVLRLKLKHLDHWNVERQEIARRYTEALAGSGVRPPSIVHGDHVWHLYVVETPDRVALSAALSDQGIATAVHYPVPLHLHAAYRELGYPAGSFPVSERAAGRILSLPMYPGMTPEQVDHVAAAIRQATTIVAAA